MKNIYFTTTTLLAVLHTGALSVSKGTGILTTLAVEDQPSTTHSGYCAKHFSDAIIDISFDLDLTLREGSVRIIKICFKNMGVIITSF